MFGTLAEWVSLSSAYTHVPCPSGPSGHPPWYCGLKPPAWMVTNLCIWVKCALLPVARSATIYLSPSISSQTSVRKPEGDDAGIAAVTLWPCRSAAQGLPATCQPTRPACPTHPTACLSALLHCLRRARRSVTCFGMHTIPQRCACLRTCGHQDESAQGRTRRQAVYLPSKKMHLRDNHGFRDPSCAVSL